jgi:hypothetical protein
MTRGLNDQCGAPICGDRRCVSSPRQSENIPKSECKRTLRVLQGSYALERQRRLGHAPPAACSSSTIDAKAAAYEAINEMFGAAFGRYYLRSRPRALTIIEFYLPC